MTTKRTTQAVPGGTWVLLTEPTGGATAVSVQIRASAGGRAYLQGGATSTLPTNNPITAPDGEWEFEAGHGQLARTMAELFPDIASPIHLFVWCERPALVTIRHA